MIKWEDHHGFNDHVIDHLHNAADDILRNNFSHDELYDYLADFCGRVINSCQMTDARLSKIKVKITETGGYIMGDGAWNYEQWGQPDVFFKNIMAGFIKKAALEIGDEISVEDVMLAVQEMSDEVDQAEVHEVPGLTVLQDCYRIMGVDNG